MKYIRVIVYAAIFVLAIVFIQQNIQDFSQGIHIRLNLYYISFESIAIPVYILLLISFMVGVLIASTYGLLDRFRMKRSLRREKKTNDRLKKELESLRSESSSEEGSSLESREAEEADTRPALELDRGQEQGVLPEHRERR